MSTATTEIGLVTSKSRVFLRRLASSIVLWTVVLLASFSSNKLVADFVFLALMLALAGLGLMEFYDLLAKRELVCFKGWGIFGGLLLMACTFFYLSGRLGKVVLPSKAND
ncbi:MAG: hypothetical protein HY043_09490, partial [Verrucomicrobia bacterium]|nr:hypothetical protein [Verrucomicrobiota bacterium]